MPLTPIAGSVRLRRLQLGLEGTFGTAVPATRRMPWTALPTVDPHTTFPAADAGTLDQAIAPYQTAYDLTIATGPSPLNSNDAPTIISAGIMGGLVIGTSGTSKSLVAAPASTSQDVFDTYTAEWGDDSNDTWIFTGGVINDFTLTYPQDQGPIQFAGNWRFAAKTAASPGDAFTGGLNADLAPVELFMADTEIYINDTSGTIETTKFSDVFYSGSVQVQNTLDVKRMANGYAARFKVVNYGRGERIVTVKLTGAKTTAWLAEATKWIAANPTERFWGLKTTSAVNASAGIPHSFDIRIPGYWMTWSPQSIGSNTAFELTGRNVYDSGLTYPFRVASVSTRGTL